MKRRRIRRACVHLPQCALCRGVAPRTYPVTPETHLIGAPAEFCLECWIDTRREDTAAMSEPTRIGADVVKLYEELRAASAARRQWERHEEALKDQILKATGYDPDDPRPASRAALGPDGRPVFEVVVTYRKGFDKDRLRTHYPAIFAECELLAPVKSIKPPQG